MKTDGKKTGRRAAWLRYAVALAVFVIGAAVTLPTVDSAPAQKKTTQKKAAAKKNGAAKSAQPMRKSGDVKKEKQRTEKEIADTKKKISENEKRTRSQLDRLNDLDGQIERQEMNIEELNNTIEELSLRSETLRDSIVRLQYVDSVLRIEIAGDLRRSHVERHRITPLKFITSAKTVGEARQRVNYLNVLQRARNNKVSELRRERERMEQVRLSLDSVQTQHSAAVKQLSVAKDILAGRRHESERVVNSLRKETATLNKVLEDKKRKIKQLDTELNRIIAEEQRKAEEEARRRQQQKAQPAKKGETKKSEQPGKSKPSSGQQGQADADRTLTGSFVQNKGRLLFPVAGKYTITGTFGRSQHGELSHVQMDNSGIDISVAPGTKARSIFGGTVSSVFFMDGYENIIIVRHGEYLSVYAGLGNIAVKKGDKVTAGQTLGTVATADGSTVLHFEVRHERTKLNPLQWVK